MNYKEKERIDVREREKEEREKRVCVYDVLPQKRVDSHLAMISVNKHE